MIRYQSQKQIPLADFDWPFQTALDENNRWVKLSECIPWDALAEGYYQDLTPSQGRPTKDARLVIGAVIVKHKLCLSDRETVAQIQENPYLQYFVGLPGFQMQIPFAPSLLVEIRKRMGASVFDVFHSAIVDSIEEEKSQQQRKKAAKKPDDDDNEPPAPTPSEGDDELKENRQGKLLLDATVAPQAIRYPTDLSLLNEAREFSEQIIDELYPKARKAYLAIAKQKRPSAKVRRRSIKQQLQYLRRNLGRIEKLLLHWPEGSPVPLPKWLLYRYWVIQHVFDQQWEMFQSKSRRCDHRIVSISQPYVRPIVRVS